MQNNDKLLTKHTGGKLKATAVKPRANRQAGKPRAVATKPTVVKPRAAATKPTGVKPRARARLTCLKASPAKPQDEPRLIGRFIASDGGFTSVGVVVTLLLVVALLFTTAQVRWMMSTSADIQFVADAGALAAQNVVAEYEVIARIADAVVLSLSLFGLTVFGIAIIVSCIPSGQEIGVKLMDFGREVFEARNSVAKQAANALDILQRAIPFLCVVNAAIVISSNHISANGEERYIGLAIPFPLTGEDTAFPDETKAQESDGELEQQNGKTAELSEEAQEAYDRMQAYKLEAYLADCGLAPEYCLYERAEWLAGLQGAQNPYFSSVDSWLFDYVVPRAQNYYKARLAAERPASSRLDEQVRSFARTRFYTYAVSEMARAYAVTSPDGTLNAYFPLLPRNNAELRQTTLYTEQVYPVTADGIIHGSPTCQECVDTGIVGYGSVSQCENGVYKGCAICDFSINTIGRVASATTSINTGFEYHYRIIAEAAENYKEAARDYAANNNEVKDSAQKSLNVFKMALEVLKTPRINPMPPGRSGCIAIVIDPSIRQIPQAFSSSFVGSNSALGPRVAISAATMAEDAATQGNNIISSFLDGVKDNVSSVPGSLALGLFDGILDIWGNALLAYGNGIESMARGLGDFLRSIPLVRSTPLASWAESALLEVFKTFGLQAVEMSAPKPVIVNSIHVARAADNAAGQALIIAKESYSSLPGSASGTIDSALVDGLLGELENRGFALLDSEFTIFTISFGDIPGLPQIPINISLPVQLAESGKSIISEIGSLLRFLLKGGEDGAIWE